jgi:4-hydroxybenzoate polyprenyltransferase
MKTGLLYTYAKALRVNQWIKNLVVFTAIIFSGNLFDIDLFIQTAYAFGIFCLLSSTSYVLNDIIDYPYDRKHQHKKKRPIASGAISIPQATFIVFVLTVISLILALLISIQFFLLSVMFLLLHFFYSLRLKQYPVLDIFTISFSFLIRTVAGEIVSGFHIPIWLILTIFFVSLFMAAVKRHAEYVATGMKNTRPSLFRYKEHLLNFMTTTFATATILSYSLYTYIIEQQERQVQLDIFPEIFPNFEGRKWLMISIPFVVYGIARYAQLLYEKEQGERPEKIITTDIPLIITMAIWGLIVVTLIYVI